MINDSGLNKTGGATRGRIQDEACKQALKRRQQKRREIEDYLMRKELGLS